MKSPQAIQSSKQFHKLHKKTSAVSMSILMLLILKKWRTRAQRLSCQQDLDLMALQSYVYSTASKDREGRVFFSPSDPNFNYYTRPIIDSELPALQTIEGRLRFQQSDFLRQDTSATIIGGNP